MATDSTTDPSGSLYLNDTVFPYVRFLQGRDGRDGRDGKDGYRGEPGEKGEVGEKGDTGAAGPRGADGRQGRIGSRGYRGERGPQGAPGTPGGGVVYVRWGRTICPSTQRTELLYAGVTAGSYYAHSGGGANYLCIPHQPEYLSHQVGDHNGSYLHGAEYKTAGNGPLNSLNHNNAPCAVCYTPVRTAILMMPARYTCPASWTLEYYGYLMSENHRSHRSMFECVDKDAEYIPGSIANDRGVMFSFIEASCNGVPCPPYEAHKELTCAVCTK